MNCPATSALESATQASGPPRKSISSSAIPLMLVPWLATQPVADEWRAESYSIRPGGMHHGDDTHKR
jgi:hypothetical protein